jgi:hypothetical protein
MLRTMRTPLIVVLVLGLAASVAQAGDLTDSLKAGTPDLKSAGALAFGPDGVLFIGDSMGGAIFAVDTGDRKPSTSDASLNVEGIDARIAAMLGVEPREARINDLAVNPASGNAYLSVARGAGADATPVLFRVQRGGEVEEVALESVKFAKAVLPDPPSAQNSRRGRSQRLDAITDLAYVDGRVFVAGLSNEEFASKLRSIPFPFQQVDKGTSVEIYHGAHGRFETHSPVRTFVPFKIGGDPHLLAAYTCTPLVKFPVADLKPGSKLQGTTVAELGNRNRPLDMVVYKKDGKVFLLLANNSRGVMKITTDGIDKADAITDPVRGGGTKGQAYQTIKELDGVVQLDKLDDAHALVLVQTDEGLHNLQTIEMP